MPAYVPPHLRGSSNNSAPSTPSAPRSYESTPGRTSNGASSRTPQSGGRSQWSSPALNSSSHPGRSHLSRQSLNNSNTSSPSGFSSSPYNKKWEDTPSKPRNNRQYNQSGPAMLHVFGDSFVGPMKLMDGNSVQIKTFKGASAKGLNNPKSIKQVSRELVPILNSLMVPPPYAYKSGTGRSALLVFGNVDLQINYVWQLANKPLLPSSFKTGSLATNGTVNTVEENIEDLSGEKFDDTRRILESATETSSSGPALGPELFVEAVAGAYISWLDREIVNGPIGERLVQLFKDRAEGSTGLPKVFIAAALPPLIEDEMLPRIPEKYVERLEEDLEKQQRMAEREQGASHWRGRDKVDDLADGFSTVGISDRPQVRPEVSPTVSSVSTPTSARTASSNPFSSLATAATELSDELTKPSAPSINTKTPITSLLQHSPPLCTLPVRVKMTNHYNSLLSAYCDKHPEVFSFFDISPAMKAGSEAPSVHGEVDRAIWACPVDRTNVHPVWEPTLPLWLSVLKDAGLDTESWQMSEDAEETFKAYEIDKRRRTAEREYGEEALIRSE